MSEKVEIYMQKNEVGHLSDPYTKSNSKCILKDPDIRSKTEENIGKAFMMWIC